MAIGNRRRPAFTLVELMISLAMVVILILGINFVFRSATDAIGAGQALNGINSDAQSTQPVLFTDLRDATKNPPCFIIASQFINQFLNEDDAKTSSDPTVIVTDNAGTQIKISNPPILPGFASTLSPALLNNRNHRVDMLKFFAHALYHRHTGNDGTYFGAESSNDAFIEYGHAALPSNDLTAYYGPSSLPNTATGVYNGVSIPGVPRIGAFASDWVLARRVTLLKDPTTITAGDFYSASPPATPPLLYALSFPKEITAWTPQNGITATGPYALNMAPLSYGSPTLCYNGTTPQYDPKYKFQDSRYDLAGMTPEQFDRTIANAILNWENQTPAANDYSGSSLWWNPLVYSFQMTQSLPQPPQNFPQNLPPGHSAYTTLSVPYVWPFFVALPGYTGVPLPSAIDPGLWLARAQCNPNIQTPVTAASLAQMAPYFLQHCSQFIVEYAGDYMQQNNTPGTTAYGAMTGIGSDGQIDYYVDANGNKHIRWYGMPRSATGAPHPSDATATATQVLIRGYDPNNAGTNGDDPTAVGATPNTAALNYFTDVIPLRDYYSMFYNAGVASGNPGLVGPPWEVDINFDPTRDYGAYTGPTTVYKGTQSTLNAFNSDPNNPPRYVAAWHDDMPAMVRILIKMDDPNNKVKDGPWYEYIFRLK